MAHRSSSRRFRPTGVGSYTAASSHPFNDRFFEDLDWRLAVEAQPASALLTVRLDRAEPCRAVLQALHFPPARA